MIPKPRRPAATSSAASRNNDFIRAIRPGAAPAASAAASVPVMSSKAKTRSSGHAPRRLVAQCTCSSSECRRWRSRKERPASSSRNGLKDATGRPAYPFNPGGTERDTRAERCALPEAVELDRPQQHSSAPSRSASKSHCRHGLSRTLCSAVPPLPTRTSHLPMVADRVSPVDQSRKGFAPLLPPSVTVRISTATRVHCLRRPTPEAIAHATGHPVTIGRPIRSPVLLESRGVPRHDAPHVHRALSSEAAATFAGGFARSSHQ